MPNVKQTATHRNAVQRAFATPSCCRHRSREYRLLSNVSGVFRSGRMSLVLGPTAGGKSLLLQACSSVAPVDTVSGDVTFNGVSVGQCCVHRTARYVDEQDNFNGSMTVRETLLFASMVQGPRFTPGAHTVQTSHLRHFVDFLVDIHSMC